MALALARKYRPRTFADVAVQSHVAATLKGAIARNRVAHGLVSADGCYSPASIMLWWLVVRFCVFPLVPQAGETTAET